MSAKEDEGLPPRVPETKRPTTLAKRPEPPPIPDGEVRIIRPPSPTAGPSHKSDFGKLNLLILFRHIKNVMAPYCDRILRQF